MAEEINEPDRVPGAPHPRETPALIGQEAAATAFLDGFNTGPDAPCMDADWAARCGQSQPLLGPSRRFLVATPDPDGDDMFGAPVLPTSLHIDPRTPSRTPHFCGCRPRTYLCNPHPQ